MKPAKRRTVLLDTSNADLIRRAVAVDTAAVGALVPYAAWCTFATALNADIAHPNRRPLGGGARVR